MTAALERLDASAFDGPRLLRPGVVAVEFSADWCPVCRAFDPVFATIPRNEPFGRAVADVSSEESPLWDRFGIAIVPSVLVFRDGREIERADGVPGIGVRRPELERVLASARKAAGPGPTTRRR